MVEQWVVTSHGLKGLIFGNIRGERLLTYCGTDKLVVRQCDDEEGFLVHEGGRPRSGWTLVKLVDGYARIDAASTCEALQSHLAEVTAPLRDARQRVGEPSPYRCTPSPVAASRHASPTRAGSNVGA